MEEWRDILKQNHPEKEQPVQPAGGETGGGSSLMQQIQELMGASGAPVPTEAEDAISASERISCPDGYMRRSPVQAYVTPPDYRRRMIFRGLLLAAAVVFAALLVAALLKSKLLSFK